MSTLDGILRASYPKALAALVRVTGSLSEAEDLLQDATVKALVRWREDGVPDSPDAWLVRTANNKAIDGFRRQAIERKHTESVRADDTPQDRSFEPQDLVLPDDLIRLVFICCHPELKRESQIALALKVLGGLSIGEIARAFLVAPRTIEQRITRAKRRLHDRGVPYEVPSPKELPARLAAVLSVIHLIFNEGYSASVDAPIIRHDLCRLSIGQARLVYRLFPGHPEVEGLLALLLLCHARAPARIALDGLPVPLDRQDRTVWNRAAINEGLALLDHAFRRGRPGTYQLQAAIHAVHCRASSWDQTDWREIIQLYDALLVLDPSPVVRLNRAVAVSRVDGARAGLDLLETLEHESGLTSQQYFFTAKAGLLEELGAHADATAAYHDALTRTRNTSEIAYIEAKIAGLPQPASHDNTA